MLLLVLSLSITAFDGQQFALHGMLSDSMVLLAEAPVSSKKMFSHPLCFIITSSHISTT